MLVVKDNADGYSHIIQLHPFLYLLSRKQLEKSSSYELKA